jgi:hypothetical protein
MTVVSLRTSLSNQTSYANQAGQALVPLLIFVVVAMMIITFTVSLVIVNSQNARVYLEGEQALSVAETGIENAMMRLLRNASYAGETLPVGSGQAVVTVTGTQPYVITAVGSLNQQTRTVVVQATRSAGLFEITSWQEVP